MGALKVTIALCKPRNREQFSVPNPLMSSHSWRLDQCPVGALIAGVPLLTVEAFFQPVDGNVGQS